MTAKHYNTFNKDEDDIRNLDDKNLCKRTAVISLVISAAIIFGLVILQYEEDLFTSEPPSQNNSWDYLLFTQQWPISYCSVYTEEKKEPPDSCNFAENKYAWTIHGVWPSRSNSDDYPEYCRRIPFNMTSIASIKDELEQHWLTIQKDTSPSYLWKHEWSKHGTCATQIQQLDTEFKYFSHGLDWNKQYNITEAFVQCDIFPDDTKLYNNAQIIDCVNRIFNLNGEPQLYCEKDHIRNELMLTEVRICMDKDLKIIGCDTLNAQMHCQNDFIYPSTVSST